MASFGKKSAKRLNTCHEDLQRLMRRVVEIRDISVVCGSRGEVEQNLAFQRDDSKLEYPNSLHNITIERPKAKAVDIVPWPEQYSDPLTMVHVAGIVLGVAAEMKIPVIWGGDWNRNADLHDQKFKDLWHFELL